MPLKDYQPQERDRINTNKFYFCIYYFYFNQMPNYEQAPMLLSIGDKILNPECAKAIRPHELETAIMNCLSARDFAAVKIIFYLTGQSSIGNFKVAEKTILDHCNISHNAYITARKKLAEMGWLHYMPGETIIIDYPKIYADQEAKKQRTTEITPQRTTEITPQRTTEITHNNKRNNKIKYEKRAAGESFKFSGNGTLDSPYEGTKEQIKYILEHNPTGANYISLKNGLIKIGNYIYKFKI